jgi:hypothetical protein
MSTTTGTEAASATSAKLPSPASTIQGSGWWQLPQRGIPSAAAGTRFFRPQCGQVTTRPDPAADVGPGPVLVPGSVTGGLA